jgi:hypothetical protein
MAKGNWRLGNAGLSRQGLVKSSCDEEFQERRRGRERETNEK